jgi:Predicted hydrolases or acyltransferases (alpha/beta hydrolase superfamily)
VVSNLLKTESSLSLEALQERVSEVMHSPDKLAFVQAMMRTMSDRFQQRHEDVRNDLKQLAAISQLDLTAIRCPTLILHGEADRDVLPEDARWAHGQIEGAELHWIPAGSHLAFWIAPDAAEAQAHAVAVLQKAAEPCADLSDGRADLPS